GIFTGTSKNEFSPKKGMSRAMFVTTLARLYEVDTSSYTGTSFDDVEAGSWYAPSVEWAYKNGITDGIGGGKFGVTNTITRQQMVALFYKSAVAFGESADIPDDFKYSRSADTAEIADWAIDGMKWALANGVISGTGNEGTSLILSPKNTATRAQAAQLILNFINFRQADEPKIASLTINGNPIDKYTVIYADNKESKKAAKALVDYVERSAGVSLPMATDASDIGEYEILIGKTNREPSLIRAERDGEDKCSFEIRVKGNYLLIAGKYEEYEGSYFGVVGLAKDLLGFGFYTDYITTIEKQDSVDIPDGYFFEDGPGFENRVVYWSGVPDESRNGEPFKKKGREHNLPDITGVSGVEPCLTDPEIIAHSIETVRGYLEKDPETELVWVCMNDSPEYCRCDRCMEVYRKEGSRSATIMLLCDTIAKDIKVDYPNCSILTAAYLHTTQPINSKLDDNVVIYYCAIENCASHDYNDPTCPLNASLIKNLTGWNKVCKKIWFWDYSANFTYSFAASPMLESFRDNREWYYSLGVRGEFNNAIMGRNGEFGALKAYVLGVLQWDPTMPDEEYQAEIDAFLEAYYGAGWEYIRKYIDMTELLSEKNHFGYHASPDSVIDYEDILLYMDDFESYWDAAEAYAADADELNRVQKSRVSWTYTMLTALYTRDYCGDDPAAKDAYVELANQFYDNVKALGVVWAESDRGVFFDPSKPPREWLPS
ncbi:MAG: DUF4838 domain-containing protein, partial [Ruminococcaceae bacterium]|nr:DUF4838 domain-containing protein [Oscillospiraceae bacterium]